MNEVTFYVAECARYHSLGEFRKDIATAEEAKRIYDSIPATRMASTKSIGIQVADWFDEDDKIEIDIILDGEIHLENLKDILPVQKGTEGGELIEQLFLLFEQDTILPYNNIKTRREYAC